MSWLEKLRRVTLPDGRVFVGGSFRGVPFFVEAADRTGGRRIVVSEFPGRDDPYVHDNGRRARTFPVEAYLIGDDYLAQRDALLVALEDVAGPGELVHPYHGVLKASCGPFTTRESSSEGGMARIAVEFTEAPNQTVEATEQSDPRAQLEVSADAAAAASAADLAADYDVEDLPSYAMASLEVAVESMSEAMASALSPVIRSTQELASLTARTRLLSLHAASLVRSPADALAGFEAVLAGIPETLVAAPVPVLRALIDAYAVDLGPLAIELTPSRERERAAQIALAAALRRMLAIAAARLAATASFASNDEAVYLRNAVAELLDEQASLASDDAYPALVQLRADLVRAVPGEAVLRRIRTIERPVALPSLVLAYQLYGSVDQESDIIARNGVRHPAVLSGSLLVLSSE